MTEKDKSFEEKVKDAIDKVVKPALRAHGGDIDLIKCEPDLGRVFVKLKGACSGCPFAQQTLKMQVEIALKQEVPEVKEVIGQ